MLVANEGVSELRVFVALIPLALLCLLIASVVCTSQTNMVAVININPDGSISPSDAPLKRIDDNTYILLSDIKVPDNGVGIAINRPGIVLDGRGHRIVGGSLAVAIGNNKNGIVVRNLVIENSDTGVSIQYASSISIVNCTITSVSPVKAFKVNGLKIANTKIVEKTIWGSIRIEAVIRLRISNSVFINSKLSLWGVFDSSIENTVFNNSRMIFITIGGGSKNLVIRNCTFYNAGLEATTKNLMFTENHVFFRGDASVNANDTVIARNIFDGGGKLSVNGYNVTVKDNFFRMTLDVSGKKIVVENNTVTDKGVIIRGCKVVFRDNIVRNCSIGVDLKYPPIMEPEYIRHGLVTIRTGGIQVEEVEVFIEDNLIENCSIGINVRDSVKKTYILHNNITGNVVGIRINEPTERYCGYGVKYDAIAYNNIVRNKIGLEFLEAIPTEPIYIYGNNFINNDINAIVRNVEFYMKPLFSEHIRWDYNGLGNYWSDYSGVDENGDGVGDTPYIKNGVNDTRPLMKPYIVEKGKYDIPRFMIPGKIQSYCTWALLIALVVGIPVLVYKFGRKALVCIIAVLIVFALYHALVPKINMLLSPKTPRVVISDVWVDFQKYVDPLGIVSYNQWLLVKYKILNANKSINPQLVVYDESGRALPSESFGSYNGYVVTGYALPMNLLGPRTYAIALVYPVGEKIVNQTCTITTINGKRVKECEGVRVITSVKKIIVKNITLEGVKPVVKQIDLNVEELTIMKPRVLENRSVVFTPVKQYRVRGVTLDILNEGDCALYATHTNVNVILDNKSLSTVLATVDGVYILPGEEKNITLELLDEGVVEGKDTAYITVKIDKLEWFWQVNLANYVKINRTGLP